MPSANILVSNVIRIRAALAHWTHWTVIVYLFNNKDDVNRAGYSCFSPSSFSFSSVVCTRNFRSLGVHHMFTRVPTIYIVMTARCALNLVQLYHRGMYQNYGVSYRFF